MLFYFQVALASPAPPYNTDNSEKLGQQIVEKEHLLEQGKIVLVTPEEASDTIDENLPTPTLTPSEISTVEDSSFLEVVGYLAAIPLLAISPFLLLGLAVFILPLLAGGSLILILMILAGSVAIMLPLIFGMPVLFLPLLLLAALDGEQPILLQEVNSHSYSHTFSIFDEDTRRQSRMKLYIKKAFHLGTNAMKHIKEFR